MFETLFAFVSTIPEDVLKAGGVVAGGVGVGVTYFWNRLRPLPVHAEPQAPRVSLTPEDRDLVFTVVRTGTDLTRALHDHGELLRDALPPHSARRTRPRT